ARRARAPPRAALAGDPRASGARRAPGSPPAAPAAEPAASVARRARASPRAALAGEPHASAARRAPGSPPAAPAAEPIAPAAHRAGSVSGVTVAERDRSWSAPPGCAQRRDGEGLRSRAVPALTPDGAPAEAPARGPRGRRPRAPTRLAAGASRPPVASDSPPEAEALGSRRGQSWPLLPPPGPPRGSAAGAA